MEEQKNNKFLLGILGAILGAFIGAIPWILMYIFGGMIIALLSVLVAMSSYYGYKATKATIDKKLPAIVAISSILAITVSTFVIIPLGLLAKEGIGVNFGNLEIVYKNEEFMSAIIGDYVISLIFTILGISGIIANLHKQIKEGATGDEIKLNLSTQPALATPEEIQAIKSIFVKNDALNKYNTLSKEEVVQDLSTQVPEARANEVFVLLKNQQIIKKKSGKYYFSEKAEKSKLNRVGKPLIISLVIIVAVMVFIIAIAIAIADSEEPGKNGNNTSKGNYSNSTNTSNINNNATKSNEEYETEHKIDIAKMKFTPLDDLLILTNNEIKTYFGTDYISYEIIAMNTEGTRMMYCFVDDSEDVEGYSAKEYIEETVDIPEGTTVQTKKISGFEFQYVKLSFEQSGKKYDEECYVYKVDKKFVCFDYCYPEGDSSSFERMISGI